MIKIRDLKLKDCKGSLSTREETQQDKNEPTEDVISTSYNANL